MPDLQMDDQAKAAGRPADLVKRGIGDADARQAVDQEQLPFERCEMRGMFGQHRVEKRTYAEFFGAFAFQRYFRDAALDNLDADQAVLDILRRNDRTAQLKAGRMIDLADL